MDDVTIYMYAESRIIPYLISDFFFLKYLKVNISKGELINIYMSIHSEFLLVG